jgi:hypothetical protein
MNTISLDDTELAARVKEWAENGEVFEILVHGTEKRRGAIKRALKALERDEPVGFLDSIRDGKMIGCVGLANETKKYRWRSDQSDNCVTVKFMPLD